MLSLACLLKCLSSTFCITIYKNCSNLFLAKTHANSLNLYNFFYHANCCCVADIILYQLLK